MKRDPFIFYIGIGSILVIAAVIWGFFIIESPSMARMRRLDQERIQDLSSITFSLDQYYGEKKKLPESLDDLTPQYTIVRYDPETSEPYEYKKLGETEYELCATFQTSNKNETGRRRYYDEYHDKTWPHEVGRTCFKRRITSNPGYPYPRSEAIFD